MVQQAVFGDELAAVRRQMRQQRQRLGFDRQLCASAAQPGVAKVQHKVAKLNDGQGRVD